MFTTYVLYSKPYDKIYIGHTSDLENRMVSHNEKATKGDTVRYRPRTIAHTEMFNTKKEAIKRKFELKTPESK